MHIYIYICIHTHHVCVCVKEMDDSRIQGMRGRNWNYFAIIEVLKLPRKWYNVIQKWTWISWNVYCKFDFFLRIFLVMSDYLPTRLLRSWNSWGKNTRVDCHSLLQGIILTQESNLGLPHCRQSLNCLSHQASPYKFKGNHQNKVKKKRNITFMLSKERKWNHKMLN